MKTIDLIHEYGEITGRPPGWEKYLSIDDFIKFKQISLTSPTSYLEQKPVSKESVYRHESTAQQQIINNSTSSDSSSSQGIKSLHRALKEERRESECIRNIATANGDEDQQDDEATELELFKAMGAE